MHRAVDVSREEELVVVILGTDHHPFDRLAAWMDSWSASMSPAPRVLLQLGYTQRRVAPHLETVDFLGHHELLQALMTARVAVSHGGPGSIFECRNQGLLPVVVPRSSALGEHVDDHQMLFTRRLERMGLIERAEDYEDFKVAMDRAWERPRTTLDRVDEVAVTETSQRLEGLVESALQKRWPTFGRTR